MKTSLLLAAGSLGAEAYVQYVQTNQALAGTVNTLTGIAYLPGGDGLIAVSELTTTESVGIYYQYAKPGADILKTQAVYEYTTLKLAPSTYPDKIALVYFFFVFLLSFFPSPSLPPSLLLKALFGIYLPPLIPLSSLGLFNSIKVSTVPGQFNKFCPHQIIFALQKIFLVQLLLLIVITMTLFLLVLTLLRPRHLFSVME
jgi:hypothetical protein